LNKSGPALNGVATGVQIVNISDATLSYWWKQDEHCKQINRKMKLRHAGKMRNVLRGSFIHLSDRRRFFLPAVVFLFLAGLNLAVVPLRAANFTASLDRDTITLGENATLSLVFEGGQSRNVPTPGVPGLQIVQTGTSQNVSFINGAMSSTVTVTFSVTARQPGEFTIPALAADVNGQQLTSQPLKLTVLRAAAPTAAAVNSGSEVVFMKLSLPGKSIYTGQMLTAQLQICVRSDVQNFGGFQFTAQPADGFTIGKMTQGQQQRARIGNQIYTVVPLTFALTALKSGTLSLGPFTANATYMVPSANEQAADPFFRQFFNQGEQKQIALATAAVTVESLPWPAQNVPPDFNGAVGDFTMAATAGPTNVAVGDPVTLPDQAAWSDFKVFPPTAKIENTDALGLEGTKTFEEIVTPQSMDAHALPPFSFSFFNPEDGKYHTLQQPSVPLAVHSGGATVMPTIAAGKNPAAENQSPQDILPIKEKFGTLEANRLPLITQPGFLVLQSLPVITLLGAVIWRKRTDNLANNPRLRRKIAVEKMIRNGTAELKKFAVENDSEAFFALLFRLLQEQLGERLNCPASAITENVVEEDSALRRAPEAVRDDLRELFQLCNQARYAPVRGSAELDSVAAQFEKAAGELQDLKA
jgi:BatD DUF11 like domain